MRHQSSHSVGEDTIKDQRRRQLLKAIAASGGAILLTSSLPERWLEPIVEAGVLPAHAQASLLPTSQPPPTPSPTPLPFSAVCDPAPLPIQAGVPTSAKVIFTGDVPVDGTPMVLTFSPAGIIGPVTATLTNGLCNFNFTPPATGAGQTISYRAGFTTTTVTTVSGNVIDVSGFQGVDCGSATIT